MRDDEFDITRTREECLHFAWPEGRMEQVGENPSILVFVYKDGLRRGTSQATRHPDVRVNDLSVRALYASYAPPPRWIGFLRVEETRWRNEDPEIVPTFQSYAVLAPAPCCPRALGGRRVLDSDLLRRESTRCIWRDGVSPDCAGLLLRRRTHGPVKNPVGAIPTRLDVG